jgi:hypothetical protein
VVTSVQQLEVAAAWAAFAAVQLPLAYLIYQPTASRCFPPADVVCAPLRSTLGTLLALVSSAVGITAALPTSWPKVGIADASCHTAAVLLAYSEPAHWRHPSMAPAQHEQAHMQPWL